MLPPAPPSWMPTIGIPWLRSGATAPTPPRMGSTSAPADAPDPAAPSTPSMASTRASCSTPPTPANTARCTPESSRRQRAKHPTCSTDCTRTRIGPACASSSITLTRPAPRLCGQVKAEICKQLLDPGSGAAVPLDLVGLAAALGVRGERQLQLMPLAQAGGVSRGGHEAGAGEEQVALARPLGRQAQAVAQLQLGFQEVGFQPLDPARRQLAAPHCLGSRARDDRAGSEYGLVVAQHLGVADAGVDHRHRRTLVAQHAHDRVQLGAALGELGAKGVPEPGVSQTLAQG